MFTSDERCKTAPPCPAGRSKLDFFPLTSGARSLKLRALFVPSLAYSEMAFFSFLPAGLSRVKI